MDMVCVTVTHSIFLQSIYINAKFKMELQSSPAVKQGNVNFSQKFVSYWYADFRYSCRKGIPTL